MLQSIPHFTQSLIQSMVPYHFVLTSQLDAQINTLLCAITHPSSSLRESQGLWMTLLDLRCLARSRASKFKVHDCQWGIVCQVSGTLTPLITQPTPLCSALPAMSMPQHQKLQGISEEKYGSKHPKTSINNPHVYSGDWSSMNLRTNKCHSSKIFHVLISGYIKEQDKTQKMESWRRRCLFHTNKCLIDIGSNTAMRRSALMAQNKTKDQNKPERILVGHGDWTCDLSIGCPGSDH